MKEFTTLNSCVEPLMKLSQMSEEVSSDKINLIEEISGLIIKELVGRGWSSGHSDYLLDNAKLVMKTISDSEIASWNIFEGEDRIPVGHARNIVANDRLYIEPVQKFYKVFRQLFGVLPEMIE